MYIWFSNWRYSDRFSVKKEHPERMQDDIIEVVITDTTNNCMCWFDLGGKEV